MKKLSPLVLDVFLKVVYIRPFFRFLKRYKPLGILFLTVLAILCLEGLKILDFQGLIDYKRWLLDLTQDHPRLAGLSFFLIYTFSSILSLPGGTVFSLIGGFLFGFVKGGLLSIFALSIGSSLSFLLFRYFFRNLFIKKGGKKIKKIYTALKEDEIYYLFAFRMFPFIPLFFTTVVIGLSSIKFYLFHVVSFIAFLPLVGMYVNVGAQISQLENLQELMAPDLLVSFSLIGVFPLFVKYLLKLLKRFKNVKEDLPLESGNLLTN